MTWQGMSVCSAAREVGLFIFMHWTSVWQTFDCWLSVWNNFPPSLCLSKVTFSAQAHLITFLSLPCYLTTQSVNPLKDAPGSGWGPLTINEWIYSALLLHWFPTTQTPISFHLNNVFMAPLQFQFCWVIAAEPGSLINWLEKLPVASAGCGGAA